jgi:hypothetical protein
MPHVIRIILTIVFGFFWWWVYNTVGASLTYLMILGSVLAVCVCCCRGGIEQPREWNWQVYLACIRRCWIPTVVLMIGLFFLGVLVAWYAAGMVVPPAPVLTSIFTAAVGAPLFVRLICCAYEN